MLQERFSEHSGVNIFLLYAGSNTILLIACSLFFNNNSNRVIICFKLIALFAFLESMLCILQFAGLWSSQNNLVKVTGSWVNPNVTAMFLAMAIPAIIYLSLKAGKPGTKIYIACIIAVGIALILLKCRTAFIGGALATAILLNRQYNIVKALRKRWVLSSLLMLLFLAFAFILYTSKQSSTDGRKFIWKISIRLIQQKPLTGYGYGRFEQPYNLQQAQYFANGEGNENEKNNASFVLMAYNEFLQNTVEGGIIGLLLFVGLLLSLLIPALKNNNSDKKASLQTVAFAGVAAFATMSVFNFTIQAIPVMCLFIIYAAILGTSNKVNYFSSFNLSKWFIKVPLILIAISLLLLTISFANAFTKVKNSNDLLREGDLNSAIEVLQPLENKLNNSQYYWQTYGAILYEQRNYKVAIEKYNNETLISSNPEIYMQLGKCYLAIKLPGKAIENFNVAKNIQPNRIAPIFGILKAYDIIKDTVNIIKTAEQIISMEPKANFKQADVYKKQAALLLEKYKGDR